MITTVTVIEAVEVSETPSQYMEHPVNFFPVARGFVPMGAYAEALPRNLLEDCGTYAEACRRIQAAIGAPCHFAFARIQDHSSRIVRAWAGSGGDPLGSGEGVFFMRADCRRFSTGDPAPILRHYAALMEMYFNNDGAHAYAVYEIPAGELARVRDDWFLVPYIRAHGRLVDSIFDSYVEDRHPTILMHDCGVESDLVVATYAPFSGQLFSCGGRAVAEILGLGPAA